MVYNSFSKSKYIEDFIIKPIKEWSDGNISQNDIEWWRLLNVVRTCKEMNIMDELHEQLLPYYEKYLYAEHFGGKGGGHLFGNFINDVAKLDDHCHSLIASAIGHIETISDYSHLFWLIAYSTRVYLLQR